VAFNVVTSVMTCWQYSRVMVSFLHECPSVLYVADCQWNCLHWYVTDAIAKFFGRSSMISFWVSPL